MTSYLTICFGNGYDSGSNVTYEATYDFYFTGSCTMVLYVAPFVSFAGTITVFIISLVRHLDNLSIKNRFG